MPLRGLHLFPHEEELPTISPFTFRACLDLKHSKDCPAIPLSTAHFGRCWASKIYSFRYLLESGLMVRLLLTSPYC